MHDEDKTSPADDIVDHMDGNAILNFFKACDGKAKPVVVRPELILAASDPDAFAKLPEIYQLGVQHADRWLHEFDGMAHGYQCGCCGKEIECSAEGNHQEVGAFITVFKADLDLSIGALVYGVCLECAAHDDKALYLKFIEGLGGGADDLVFSKKESQYPAWHDAILKELTVDTMEAWAKYIETPDLMKYLLAGKAAVEKAIAAAEAQNATPPVETVAAVPKEAVNLLVGED